mmetsp:Transcript_9082/g.17805  ORF Transcript_9082/g.17805 Transcript_9082/m.17805 type:complete len:94 (-) Transcript_9082:145-426(-)
MLYCKRVRGGGAEDALHDPAVAVLKAGDDLQTKLLRIRLVTARRPMLEGDRRPTLKASRLAVLKTEEDMGRQRSGMNINYLVNASALRGAVCL